MITNVHKVRVIDQALLRFIHSLSTDDQALSKFVFALLEPDAAVRFYIPFFVWWPIIWWFEHNRAASNSRFEQFEVYPTSFLIIRVALLSRPSQTTFMPCFCSEMDKDVSFFSSRFFSTVPIYDQYLFYLIDFQWTRTAMVKYNHFHWEPFECLLLHGLRYNYNYFIH